MPAWCKWLSLFWVVLMGLMLGGCDQIMNKAGSKYLKSSLKDTCGHEDSACIAAVEQQFDTCHLKIEGDWNNYMNSSYSEEDALLDIYSRKLYACIVDDQGTPYFFFDP